MLKLSPKRPEWPIYVSWNAGPVIRSMLPQKLLESCDVSISVAADSDAQDDHPEQMFEGGVHAATINSETVTVRGHVCPPGTVATIRLIGGIAGVKYQIDFDPTYLDTGAGEGEQMVLDVVERLPPSRAA